jgi:hypothetical protein
MRARGSAYGASEGSSAAISSNAGVWGPLSLTASFLRSFAKLIRDLTTQSLQRWKLASPDFIPDRRNNSRVLSLHAWRIEPEGGRKRKASCLTLARELTTASSSCHRRIKVTHIPSELSAVRADAFISCFAVGIIHAPLSLHTHRTSDSMP